MKNRIALICIGLLISWLPFPLVAQYPNWGWGPAISVSQNGSTITCSTVDPFTGNNRMTSVSDVADWEYDDGVVAWVTPGGTVGGLTYDVNLGNFRNSTFSSNSGNVIQNRDGVVAWVSSAGTVGGAIYDPILANWRSSTFSSNSGNAIINQDGVVAYVSSAGTVGGAIYDPSLANWRSSTFSSNAGNTISNTEGVVAWVSSAGTVGGAVYDIGLQNWRSSTFSSNSGNSVYNADGVIAYVSSAGTIGGAAYDFNLENWRSTTFASSSSITSVGILDGTVQWTDNSGSHKYGYKHSTQAWASQQNTELYCQLFTSHATGAATPHLTYLWCHSLGASNYTYDTGNGHTITRRWGWKQYDSPGNYNLELSVYNTTTNSTCTDVVNVNGSATPEIASDAKLAISPVPAQVGQVLRVSCDKAMRSVELLDLLGRVHVRVAHVGNEVELETNGLAAGAYMLRIATSGDAPQLRRVLLQ